MEKIKGLLVAPFTAFTEDNQINTAVIPQYAALLKRNGLSGVFINGSSGEGYLLTADERQALAEAWVKEQTPAFKVMVHVGATPRASGLGAWGAWLRPSRLSDGWKNSCSTASNWLRPHLRCPSTSTTSRCSTMSISK